MANSGFAIPMPTQEYLRECLDYDAATGILTWKVRPLAHFKNAHGMNTFNAKYAGAVAGHGTPRGYLTVHLSGKSYLARRVVWKWMTGREPAAEIDHRNEDKSCNRWTNIREASHQQNTFNRRAPRVSATGVKGVVWDKQRQKYAAYARLNGRSTFLGRFASIDAAATAYRDAVSAQHGEFINA
jgi:hypothetical protein